MPPQRLQRTSLREQAREAIRDRIIGGEIPSGEIFSAGTVAAQLGVSATPVREALLDLASAGLVEVVPNRGFRVLTITDDDLDEIMELRLLIEVPSMTRVAATTAGKDDFAAFEAHLVAMERAAEAGDVAAFLSADRAFHLGLLERLGNRRLVETIAALREQTRLTGLQRLAASGRLVASAREHRPILDAIRRGDAAAAEELMHAHIVRTRGDWAGRDDAPED